MFSILLIFSGNTVKGEFCYFKPEPYVYIFGCGNGSYSPRVLSLVQEIVSDNSCDTAALSAT